MRKRWKFNPWPYVALWLVAGFIGMFVVAALTDGCNTWSDGTKTCGINGPISHTTIIEIVAWLGPIVIPSVLYVAAAIVVGSTRALWEAWPRRIEEPVVEDLREIEPKKR